MSYYHHGAYIVIPDDTVFFITTTVIDWVDVFTRDEYKQIIARSLDYCRRNKGLQLHAWVLMTNHLHLIASHNESTSKLESVIGDFKKHTSKKVIQAIKSNPKESRRNWLLSHFDEDLLRVSHSTAYAESKSRHRPYFKKHYHLWQKGYDSFCIYNIKMLRQKIDYLHANPVRAGIVNNPIDYIYCSFPNYCGKEGLFEIDIMDLGVDDPTIPSKW